MVPSAAEFLAPAGASEGAAEQVGPKAEILGQRRRIAEGRQTAVGDRPSDLETDLLGSFFQQLPRQHNRAETPVNKSGSLKENAVASLEIDRQHGRPSELHEPAHRIDPSWVLDFPRLQGKMRYLSGRK